jgi:hypothetical protein
MDKTNSGYMPRRRALWGGLALLSGTALLSSCKDQSASAGAPTPDTTTSSPAPVSAGMSTVAWIEVWKTPTCGCCQAWVEYLQREGFTVKANDVPQTAPIRTKLGIPDDMGSCHTALIAGFAIEGHVPASEIRRLLAEPESLRQQVIGLSVPGMPIGSPGMEMGTKRDKFDVMLVLKGGKSRVYQSYSYLA